MKHINEAIKWSSMLSAASVVLLCMGMAQAAEITWEPVGSVDSSTEVNNEGTTVLAYKLNESTTRTANGVTFTGNKTQNGVTLDLTKVGAGTHYQNVGYFVDPISSYFSGPDANEYGEICRGMQDAQGDITLEFTGLTDGQQYLVQFWTVDFRRPSNPTVTIAMDGGTPSGLLNYSSYVIGRFTADAATASFVLNNPTSDRVINAVQLRAISASTGTTTTTTLESNSNPSDFGDNVTFTATIKDAGVTATSATGTVAFKVDGTVVEAAATITAGVASYSTSSLAAGARAVVAIYSGDSTYAGSTSSELTQTVNSNSAMTWEPVVSSGGGTKFDSTGVNNEGSTVLAMMVNGGGPTTVNGVTFLNWDNKTQNGVTVGYTGGPGTTFQGVNYFITGSPNDYFSGPTDAERDAYIHAMAGARDGIQSITFSGLTVDQEYLVQVWAVDMRSNGTVNGYFTLALDGGAPSGQLEYFGPGGGVSSYVIGRFTANATTCALALGDAYRPQFNAVQLRAIQPAGITTTTTLVSSANPASHGANVTFTATVRNEGAPATDATGTITFEVDGSSVSVEAVVNGEATYSTSALAVGDRTINAIYSGDTVYDGSSNNLVQTITDLPYDTWADGYELVGGPHDDDDGDGMTNFREFAFGLVPTSGASVNPVTDTSDLATLSQFSYTRNANSGLTYTIWTSVDLIDWDEAEGSVQEPGEADEFTGVQTVLVEVNPMPGGNKVFVRVMAD